VEEDAPAASSEPHVLARSLATRKARAAAVLVRGSSVHCCVLGADTVVALPDGRLLGKPVGRDEAASHLRALSGTTHRVITGVCLIDLPSGLEDQFHVETRVTMRCLDPVDIDDYVDSGAGFDKAGGYAIQEGGDRFVTRLDGSWSNVVGLPVEETLERLRSRGIGPP
jgi:septum formation protein